MYNKNKKEVLNMFKKKEKDLVKKILVVRYKSIGDTVFSLPFYRELRKNHGENCQIDAIAKNADRILLETSPYIDNIICDEELCFSKNKNIFKIFKILSQYDKVYFLFKDIKLTILTFLVGIKERVGLGFKGNLFLTKSIKYDTSINVIDLYLRVLEEDGLTVENRTYENAIKISEDKFKTNKTLQNKYITIQAFSRCDKKDWNINGWEKVLDYVTNTLNYDVVLLGGDKDYESYTQIKCNKDKVHNLCGCSLEESIGYVKNSELHIGIDSGLIHISALLHKNSILLNGSTSLIHWGPRNPNCHVITKNFECSPCLFNINYRVPCLCETSPKCLDAISPEEVIEEIKLIVK